MATTPKQAINQQITDTASATSYPSPTGTKSRIVACTVTNTETATNYTFNGYIIPQGDGADTDTKMINTRTISGGESYPCPEIVGHVLDAGDLIQFDASTTLKLNVVVSVVQIT